MNLDLLKLCEFYTHPDDDEFTSIGPLDVTTVYTDENRIIFVTAWWEVHPTGGRVIRKRTHHHYSDAISYALQRSGWGTWDDMVRYEQDEVG